MSLIVENEENSRTTCQGNDNAGAPPAPSPFQRISRPEQITLLQLLRHRRFAELHRLDGNLYLRQSFILMLSYAIHYCGNVVSNDELRCWQTLASLGVGVQSTKLAATSTTLSGVGNADTCSVCHLGLDDSSDIKSNSSSSINSDACGCAQALVLRLHTRKPRYFSLSSLRSHFRSTAAGEGGSSSSSEADGKNDASTQRISHGVDVLSLLMQQHAVKSQPQIDVDRALSIILQPETTAPALVERLTGTAIILRILSNAQAELFPELTRHSRATDPFAASPATQNPQTTMDPERVRMVLLAHIKAVMGHHAVTSASDMREICRALTRAPVGGDGCAGGSATERAVCALSQAAGSGGGATIVRSSSTADRPPTQTTRYGKKSSAGQKRPRQGDDPSLSVRALFTNKSTCLHFISFYLLHAWQETRMGNNAESSSLTVPPPHAAAHVGVKEGDWCPEDYGRAFTTEQVMCAPSLVRLAQVWDVLIGPIVALTSSTKRHLNTLGHIFDLVNRFDPRRAMDYHVTAAGSPSTTAHSGGHGGGNASARQVAAVAASGAMGSGSAHARGSGATASTVDDPAPFISSGSGGGIAHSVILGKTGMIPCPQRRTLPVNLDFHTGFSISPVGDIRSDDENRVAKAWCRSLWLHPHTDLLFAPKADDGLPLGLCLGDNGGHTEDDTLREKGPAIPRMYIFSSRATMESYCAASATFQELVAVSLMGATGPPLLPQDSVPPLATAAAGKAPTVVVPTAAKGPANRRGQGESGAGQDALPLLRKDRFGYVIPAHRRILRGMREAASLQRLEQLWFAMQQYYFTSVADAASTPAKVLINDDEEGEASDAPSCVGGIKKTYPALPSCHPFVPFGPTPSAEALIWSAGPCSMEAEAALLSLTPMFVWGRCAEFISPLLESAQEYGCANTWLWRLLLAVPLYEFVDVDRERWVRPMVEALVAAKGWPAELWRSPVTPPAILFGDPSDLPIFSRLRAAFLQHVLPQALNIWDEHIHMADMLSQLQQRQGAPMGKSLSVPFRYHKRGQWWLRLILNLANHECTPALGTVQRKITTTTAAPKLSNTKFRKSAAQDVALNMIEMVFGGMVDWRITEEAWHQNITTAVKTAHAQADLVEECKTLVGEHLTAHLRSPDVLYASPPVHSNVHCQLQDPQEDLIRQLAAHFRGMNRNLVTQNEEISCLDRARENVLWAHRQFYFMRRADLIECERIFLKLYVSPRRWAEPPKELLTLRLREPEKVYVRGRRTVNNGWTRYSSMITTRTEDSKEFIASANLNVTSRSVSALQVDAVTAGSSVEDLAAEWYRSGCGRKPHAHRRLTQSMRQHSASSPSASAAPTAHSPLVRSASHSHLGIPWAVGHMEGWWIEQAMQALLRDVLFLPCNGQPVTTLVYVDAVELPTATPVRWLRLCTFAGTAREAPPTVLPPGTIVVASASTTAPPYDWLCGYQTAPASAHHHHALLTVFAPHTDLVLRFVEYLGTGDPDRILSSAHTLQGIREALGVTTMAHVANARLFPRARRCHFLSLVCHRAPHLKGFVCRGHYNNYGPAEARKEQRDAFASSPTAEITPDQRTSSRVEAGEKTTLPAAPHDVERILSFPVPRDDDNDDDDNRLVAVPSLAARRNEHDCALPTEKPDDCRVQASAVSPSAETDSPSLHDTIAATVKRFHAALLDKDSPFVAFERVMACVPLVPLARLLRLMLLSPPSAGYGMKFSGFPDLVAWCDPNTTDDVMLAESPAPDGSSLSPSNYVEPFFLLSEVKSPNDQLSEKQLTVNDTLLRCGFTVHLLHVVDADKEELLDGSINGMQSVVQRSGALNSQASPTGLTSARRAAQLPRRRVCVPSKISGTVLNPVRIDSDSDVDCLV